jgi:hypothetical protein
MDTLKCRSICRKSKKESNDGNVGGGTYDSETSRVHSAEKIRLLHIRIALIVLNLKNDGPDIVRTYLVTFEQKRNDPVDASLTAPAQDFEKASLEWCRGNSKIWENPVRENTTHYTVGYTCKVVLRSYLALGCEVT